MSHLEDILNDPKSHDLMWALRVIEAQFLDFPRIGDSQTPRHDPVRLDQPPNLGFATSEIAKIKPREHGYRVEVNNFGMWGPNGAMPLAWTESVRDRLHHAKDPTLADFTGVFHHRMISLFYKSWSRSRKTTDFDRPGEQRFFNYLGSLAGVAAHYRSTKGKDVPGFAKIYYSGLLGRYNRDPQSLAALLEDFFEAPFAVEEYVARWVEVSPDERSSMGDGFQLGTAMLGERCWDCQTKFRLVAGPLNREELKRFAIEPQAFVHICRWLESWIGHEMEWELKLLVKGEEAPGMQLGGSRLGRDTWIFSEQPTGVLGDVIMDPPSTN
ncbi:MAG: type VI secretion system baseplate subunit TssG [Puniceicoccales bacterium]